MARQSYGQTWWGTQWLNALTHIDYDNRLPRGRSYANKGAVRDLVVHDGLIQAKVKGSRARPYQIRIEVPPILEPDAKQLLARIAADPALIARLLNRELDPVLLELADQLGLKVFPSRWNELSMHCSCPDWAVPCKHLAAVIYLLSREIDGNPFLVFSLRGIDLAQALQSHDIHIEREAQAALPTVADLLQSTVGTPSRTASTALDQLDFCAIPALLEPLLKLLPVRPACFPSGDLQAIYKRQLTCAAKQANRILDATSGAYHDPASHPFHANDRPRIEIDETYTPQLSGLIEPGDWGALASALEALEPVRLSDVQPEVAALHYVRRAALHLLAAGAVTAQIFSLEGGEIGLRWVPAMLDDRVHAFMQHLAGGLPAGMVRYRNGRRAAEIHSEAQATTLCSLFLDHFVRQWAVDQKQKLLDDKTLALFFRAGRARYDGPGEGAIAAGIRGWLARHHLARHVHNPVLCLNETHQGDFAVSVAVGHGAGEEEPVPLSAVLSQASWAAARFAVLQDVSLLAEVFPPLHDYVRDGARTPITLDAGGLPELLFDTLPVIRLLGIRILMPKALERLLRPQLSLRVRGPKTADSTGLLKADQVFTFDWKVALGGHQLSQSQFEKLVTHATGVIRFKGEYVYLDPHDIEHLRAQLQRPPRLEDAESLRVVLAGEYAGAAVALDAQTRRIIRELMAVGDVAVPTGLVARLRPYQLNGYAWLYRNIRIGFGSVIADDMGLGKTVQVIAALQKLKEEGVLRKARALIVVPTSLLTNWQKEIARFAPGLTVDVFHGGTRKLSEKRPDVLLTSYGVARREAATLKALAWQVLVVDEAQNIKNPAAAQTKAIKSIPSRCRIAMSGTPVENRLSEYWSIMDFANRGYLGSPAWFAREFAVPIQSHHDVRAIERFRRVTAPFLLRRLKSDKRIIDDLPEKIEQDQYCTLTPRQTALYESVVREGLRAIRGESSSFKRQGLVLRMILALKQICNHPAQYLKEHHAEAALSGKAERFLELIDEIYASHQKVLVFTQFREMGKLLSAWLGERYGQDPPFLHGGVARNKRDTMVEHFQNDRTERVFILSLKAGGTGLNLTSAANVIHYDLWWNPAVESQATDRAYRIGQRETVQVHRLITRDTFEERINELIRAKRTLADLTVGVGEKWLGSLSDEELTGLFALSS
jgi:uncharacterized Zn finger protein/superfamily II DNA or RNA helicase